MVWSLLFIFKIITVSIAVSIQFYFYRWLRGYTVRWKSERILTVLLIVVFSLFTLPIIPMIFWGKWIAHLPHRSGLYILYPVYCWHFSWFILFLLLSLEYSVRQIVRAFRWAWNSISPKKMADLPQQFQPSRRQFLQKGFLAATGTVFSASVYGAIAHDQFGLTRISIPIRNLPNEFEGFNIALLSDIHSSVFMTKDTMLNYARATNDLQPDLIAVTGDFVNSMVDEVYPFAEAFSALSAPHGVFGVLGNHDYYTRDVETVANVVNECGIRLLRNDHALIEKNQSSLILAGIDDAGDRSTASSLTDIAYDGVSENSSSIFLSHRPYYFPYYSSKNIDLTLSGHTHGGQVVFARFGNEVLAPARIASPYVAGLYSIGSSKMYVSRGIGTVGVPIRINCPPEITLITLHSSVTG